MKYPSKVTPYKDSTLSKLPILLKLLNESDYTVLSLFDKVRQKMTLKEYGDALDCLFILGKITLNKEVIHYVDRNIL